MAFLLLLIASGVLASAPVQAQVIMTLAGGGNSSNVCGDGGAATKACLSLPGDVAVDGAGNVFIADTWNGRIRKVDRTGLITTFAGKGGSVAYCGDGGPAASACLGAPAGLAFDGMGNLFVSSAARIRKIDAAGTITTVAGNGTPAYCGDDGPATSACLNSPEGIVVDGAGNLYIADALNHRVRKVGPDGTITTIAGNGTSAFCGDGGPATGACLSLPTGIALDGLGNLFIADAQNDRIRRVDAFGTITTVAGSGIGGSCGDGALAVNACLEIPLRVAFDAGHNMYISDTGNSRIRKVNAGGVITTFAGTTHGYCGDGGLATAACLASPASVVVDGSALIIADTRNYRIRKVDAAFLTHPTPFVSGCLKTSALVTLGGPAPIGGIVVTLGSDNPNVSVPATVKIAAGAISQSFSIKTSPVPTGQLATISAAGPGWLRTTGLLVKPMGPKTVTLAPNPVVGGNVTTGTVTLECAAGPGDITVTLTSSKPAVAAPDVTSITFPVGAKTQPVSVTTAPVGQRTKVGITATANLATKKTNLIVDPIP